MGFFLQLLNSQETLRTYQAFNNTCTLFDFQRTKQALFIYKVPVRNKCTESTFTSQGKTLLHFLV